MKKNRDKDIIKILFFIGSLGVGGKERRLIELLSYLQSKGGYHLKLIVTKDEVDLPKFFDLDIEMVVLKEKPFIFKFNYFFHFYKLVRAFDPHIIHTWGRMQTLYALPSALITKTKVINGQITSAPPKMALIDSVIDRANFLCSDVVLSNSHAGIGAYNPPVNKTEVIYNGLDLNRFEDLPDVSIVKDKYRINTRYLVLMIANYTQNKDYERFFRLGNFITKDRKDITWMGVGYFEEDSELIKNCRNIIGTNPFLRIQSEVTEVEALVNACDVGVLFSNTAVHGEGISNAIIEYMALGKPVVANDAGGTREVVLHNKNGYLLQGQSDEEIRDLIINLITNKEMGNTFGVEGRKRIVKDFSLSTMGNAFVNVYEKILINSSINR